LKSRSWVKKGWAPLLNGHGRPSEEICNKYAAQTMFCQIQAFQTEKKPDFDWYFLFSKKA